MVIDFTNPWGQGGKRWPPKWMGDEVSDDNSVVTPPDSTIYGLKGTEGSNGFLNVKNEQNGQIISIVKYCRVKNLSRNSDKSRETFEILDWPHIGVKASVKAINKTTSRFKKYDYLSGGTIVFNKSEGKIKYGTSDWIKGYTNVDPIPKGTYNIWLPDYYHKYGNPYLNYTENACIWFRLGSEDSDRYLHVGSASLGCVSIGKNSEYDSNPDYKKWDEVYNYLKLRRNGNKYVGKLIVQ